jgi:D-tyrosyl-tRNA(Tyr) deacylase
MRAVIQRVSCSQVEVEGQVVGAIDQGLCVLVAAGADDTDRDALALADKVANLRIFADQEGKMNLSVLDVAGQVLAISQFTLYGDARKGRRPAFTAAMEPAGAEKLYEGFVEALRATGISRVECGVFRADMKVSLTNDGPITILLDSKKLF